MSKLYKFAKSLFKGDKEKASSGPGSTRSSLSINKKKKTPPPPAENAGEKIAVQTLSSLVKEVDESVSFIKKYLKENNLEEPSFQEGNTTVLPHNLQIRQARKTLNEALLALRALNQYDSFEYIKEVAYSFTHTTAFIVAAKYRIAWVLDDNGEAMHISEICEKANCRDELKLTAALRVLTQSYVFKEVKEGYFAHTRISLEMRDDRKTDLLTFDNLIHCGYAYYESMVKYPSSLDPKETPFNIGLKTDKSFFEYITSDPAEMARFHNAMEIVSLSSLKILQTVYPWDQLGDATVVDVGAGRGHVSKSIHNVAPKLKFTLQDLGPVITEAETLFDAEAKPQFAFMEHDFFTPQPVSADVYLLRMILHDFSNDKCVEIIKNLVGHLKPGKYGTGGRILVIDTVLRPAIDRPPSDLSATQINMGLIMLLNTGDRVFSAVKALFLAVDSRFKFKKWGDGGPQSSEVVEAWLEE